MWECRGGEKFLEKKLRKYLEVMQKVSTFALAFEERLRRESRKEITKIFAKKFAEMK